MTYVQMHPEIVKRLAKIDGYIPSMVEYKRDGKTYFADTMEADVATLEQACEVATRQARKAIDRYAVRPRPSTAKTAATHIWRARAFRALSLEAQKQQVTEAAMPFPCMSVDELRAMVKVESE